MNSVLTLLMAIRLFATHPNENGKVAEIRIEFEIHNAGIPVRGRIEGARAEINFDEKKLDKSFVVARVQSKNIRTGISVRDKHLQRSDYFHSDLFREITITSTGFKKAGRNRFIGNFNLTIKQFKKEIIVPFQVERHGGRTTYAGTFKINRLDFGLGEQSAILDNVVTVFVSVSV